MKQDWLSLTEYSMRHKVSISTLRRRIKAADIHFRLEDGKYLILDNQEDRQTNTHGSAEDRFEYSKSSPSQANLSSAVSASTSPETADQFRVENIVKSGAERRTNVQAYPANQSQPVNPQSSSIQNVSALMAQASQTGQILQQQNNGNSEATESVLTAANRLLTDLKKAYTQVLQEKEQIISDLREENSDLKTLIKVLESENDRLRDMNA